MGHHLEGQEAVFPFDGLHLVSLSVYWSWGEKWGSLESSTVTPKWLMNEHVMEDSLLTTCTYWFILHGCCGAQLVVMLPLRETHPRTAREVPVAALGRLVSLVVSSGLNYSCWFVPGVCLPRGPVGSC